MAYKYKTPYYRIPVMGYGDILTEEQEWVQMNTIDNLFRAAMLGLVKGIFEEGGYSVVWNDAHNECSLRIRPLTETGSTLSGLVNGRFFMTKEDIRVGTLYPNQFYHIYVEYVYGLETDSRRFNVNAYSAQQEETDSRIYLCTVSTEGDGTVTSMVDKLYVRNIFQHTLDGNNPHGNLLLQEQLEISNRLSVRGAEVSGSVYSSIDSPGESSSSSIEFVQTPVFVTVTPESLGAGEIACSINGHVVSVTNSGDSGVRLNLKVDVQ